MCRAEQDTAIDLRQTTERLRLMAMSAPRVLPDWRLRELIESELHRLALCIDRSFAPEPGAGDPAARLRRPHEALRSEIDGLIFQAANGTDLAALKAGVLQVLDRLGEHWASAHALHLSETPDDPGPLD